MLSEWFETGLGAFQAIVVYLSSALGISSVVLYFIIAKIAVKKVLKLIIKIAIIAVIAMLVWHYVLPMIA